MNGTQWVRVAEAPCRGNAVRQAIEEVERYRRGDEVVTFASAAFRMGDSEEWQVRVRVSPACDACRRPCPAGREQYGTGFSVARLCGSQECRKTARTRKPVRA